MDVFSVPPVWKSLDSPAYLISCDSRQLAYGTVKILQKPPFCIIDDLLSCCHPACFTCCDLFSPNLDHYLWYVRSHRRRPDQEVEKDEAVRAILVKINGAS